MPLTLYSVQGFTIVKEGVLKKEEDLISLFKHRRVQLYTVQRRDIYVPLFCFCLNDIFLFDKKQTYHTKLNNKVKR